MNERMILEDRSVEKRRIGVCGFGGLEIMESEIEEVGVGGRARFIKTHRLGTHLLCPW